MRVAMVGSFPLQLDRLSGGVERVFSNLVECLTMFCDCEIHVVTCSSGLRKPVCVNRNGVSYHYLPSQGRLQTLSLYMLDRRRVHRALAEVDPDVVHAQDAIKHGYICQSAGYPLVVSVHGIERKEGKHFWTIRHRLRATVRSLVVERYCVKNAPHIIQQAGYAERCFGSLITGKTHNIDNPIADKFFDVESAEEEGRLLYVGSVIPRKRPLDLVRAVAKVRDRFPNVSLRIAGATPDEAYLQSIGECIASHGLERNVRLTGSVTEDQLLEEYQKCVLLVLPSIQETSPMVIGEAMAAGKPVVATSVGAVPYLVDDGQTGFLVDVGDISALADRIESILADSELRSRMGRIAKEQANHRFRSETVAAKVRQVYCEAIAAADQRP